jgi:hypothetical protein
VVTGGQVWPVPKGVKHIPEFALPDQPIMKYVHPTDRLRPRYGVAVGLVAPMGMLALGIMGRNVGPSST